MSKKKRRKGTDFTVLDAINLAVIPKKHRIPAIAAFLIAQGDGFPTPVIEAQRVASLLADADGESDFVDRIIGEVHRQLQIKIKRLDARRKLRQVLAMGSELDTPIRINRICTQIFGVPRVWMPVGKIAPAIKEAHYDWLHRSDEGTLVAGVLAQPVNQQVDELIPGFVYRDRGGPVKFVRLRAQARTLKELCALLGLPRGLRNTARVDWRRRSFIVSDTNHLPWVFH